MPTQQQVYQLKHYQITFILKNQNLPVGYLNCCNVCADESGTTGSGTYCLGDKRSDNWLCSSH